MLLSDKSIEELIDKKNASINPFNKEQLQPCSYDVTLSDKLVIFFPSVSFDKSLEPCANAATKDLMDIDTQEIDISNGYVLTPGEFVLGSTVEKISLPNNVAARFEGKSSLGRMGLTTHITAGFIDAGFSGNITLEMKNETSWNIIIAPGMRIGQLCFFAMDSSAKNPYGSEGLGSHYQGQAGPTSVRK